MTVLERKPRPIDKEHGQSRAPEDFGELARLHRNLVFSIASRIVRNPHVAEDVTQEAMIRAFKAWPQFRGDCDPRAWLARVATNVAINHVMRTREFPDSIFDRADESDVAGQVERTAMCKALRGAIDHLPPMLRRPLVMFEYDGIGCEEIAKRLGISPGAVRVRLLRGRRHLKHEMSSWRSEV
jgi:RNA polymerase sigma-70 factor (ECF subfamily)